MSAGVSRTRRFEVFHRDGFACRYCGRSAPDVVLEVDHVVSRAHGGSDYLENLVTACFDCNRGKRHRSVGARSISTVLRLMGLEECADCGGWFSLGPRDDPKETRHGWLCLRCRTDVLIELSTMRREGQYT